MSWALAQAQQWWCPLERLLLNVISFNTRPGTLCIKEARKSLLFLLIAPVLSIPSSSLIFTLFVSSVLSLLKFLFYHPLIVLGTAGSHFEAYSELPSSATTVLLH